MNERTFFNLSAITGRIQEILQPYIGKLFWVKAEISSGRERGGSFYCDLINIGYWLTSIREKMPETVDKFFEDVNQIDGISISPKQARTDRFSINNIDMEGIEKLTETIARLKQQIDKVIEKEKE
jgi:hypothetical protein